MGRKIRLVVFALGVLLLALLIERVGPSRLTDDAERVGPYLVPIVLIYLPVYLLNAVSWRLVMAGTRPRYLPSYFRTLAYVVSGFALNFLTPVLAVGGEPYRVAAIAPWLGRRRAVASVASYYMLHALANVLIWLTALCVALAIAPWPRPVQIVVGVVALALLVAVAVVFRGLRRGVFEDLLDLGMRIPLLRTIVARAQHRRAALARIDAHMATVYRLSPPRFFAALGIEYLARAISMVEFWLIFIALGLHASYLQALVVGSLTSLVLNVIFFVPLAIGTKEAALYMLVGGLGLPFAAGLATSLVSRVRELVWAGVGVGIVPIVRHGRVRR